MSFQQMQVLKLKSLFQDSSTIQQTKWANPYRYLQHCRNEGIRELVEQVLTHVKMDDRNVYLDVKHHTLKVGDIPALPHWHIDCIGSPYLEVDYLDNVHHLLLVGDKVVSTTEFLLSKHPFKCGREKVVNWGRQLEGCKIETAAAPMNTIIRYGNALHRATPAIADGWRLLIRVTQTRKKFREIEEFKPTCLKS